jgi:three-Cys-motif partner protein
MRPATHRLTILFTEPNSSHECEMPPRETVWAIDEHTRGKHIVLREYLKAWYPIMCQTFDKCVLIDGFAGPGSYAGGEPGSPLIALDVYRNHSAIDRMPARMIYYFIESRSDRAEALQRAIDSVHPSLPPQASTLVINETFVHTIARAMDAIEENAKVLAPAFVMVDPFGVSDTPIEILQRLLNNPKCELYISVMASWIARFCNEPEFEAPLNSLFGDESWRTVIDEPDGSLRVRALLDLYESKLRRIGGTFVLRFDLYRGGAFQYTIFFVTKNRIGSSRMKDAIWKISPGGEYEFRGRRTDQLTLSLDAPNYDALARELAARMRTSGAQRIEQLEEWMDGDETLFRRAHLKKTLAAMERGGKLAVSRTPGTRAGAFPLGTTVRLVEP